MTPKTESKSILGATVTQERAVIYARVSGDDTKKEGDNIKDQLEKGRERAQRLSYFILAEMNEDEKRHTSGADDDLPVLNQIIDMARKGEFDVLIVRELDRLARKLSKQLNIEENLTDYGVRVEYFKYDFPDTAEGRVNKNFLASFAEYEREKIRERMVRGRERASKRGLYVSGIVPLGYDKVDGYLVINEDEAVLIRMIFNWYVYDGLTLSKIAAKLDAMGIERLGKHPSAKSVRNKTRRKGDSKQEILADGNRQLGWNSDALRRIITNETYAGRFYYGQNKILVKVPAIIEEKIFDLAQGRLKQNKILHAPRNYDYLLSGMCTCGKCGSSFSCSTGNHGNGKVYPKYGCTSRRQYQYRTTKCDAPILKAPLLETPIWEWVKGYLKDPNRLSAYINDYNNKIQEINAPIIRQIEIADKLISERQAEMSRLVDAFTKGIFEEDDILPKKKQLKEAIVGLQKQKQELNEKLAQQVISQQAIDDIMTLSKVVCLGVDFADNNLEARRQLMIALKVEVVITPLGGKRARVDASCILGGYDFVYGSI